MLISPFNFVVKQILIEILLGEKGGDPLFYLSCQRKLYTNHCFLKNNVEKTFVAS